MQLAAFVCVICAICGRITRKSTQAIRTEETTMSLADFADLRRRTPTTTLTTICLSLRNNAALLHSLCDLCAICGRITCKRTQSICTEETTISPADLRRRTPKQQTAMTAKQYKPTQPVFLCEIM